MLTFVTVRGHQPQISADMSRQTLGAVVDESQSAFYWIEQTARQAHHNDRYFIFDAST